MARRGPRSCGNGSGSLSTPWCTNRSRRRWTGMANPVVDTLAYYDRRAANFAAQTTGLDLGPLYDRLLRYVRPGGRILDAGCGPGRDALAFAERGHEVVAFDASEEMVRARPRQHRRPGRRSIHALRGCGVARGIRRHLGLRVAAARAGGVIPQ